MHLGSCFIVNLLFLDEVSAVLGGVYVGSPFLGVSLGLDFEFVSNSLTFQLPIIFVDC